MNTLKKLLCLALCFAGLTAQAQDWDFTLVAGYEYEGGDSFLPPNWQTVKVQAPASEAPSVQPFFVVGETWLTEKDVATIKSHRQDNNIFTTLIFTPQGARTLKRLTTQHRGKIVLLTDGREQYSLTAALIVETIDSGSLQLTTGIHPAIADSRDIIRLLRENGLRVYLTHPEHGRKLMLQEMPKQPVLTWEIDPDRLFTADDFNNIRIESEKRNVGESINENLFTMRYRIVATPTAAARQRMRQPRFPFLFMWLLLDGGQPPALLNTLTDDFLHDANGDVALHGFFLNEADARKALAKLRRAPSDDKTSPKQ